MRALEALVDGRQCILEAGSGGNREVGGRPCRKPCGSEEKPQPGDGAPSGYSACGFHRLLGSKAAPRNIVRYNAITTVMSICSWPVDTPSSAVLCLWHDTLCEK